MDELTHTDKDGKAAMVNVGDKQITRRIAAASARVRMSPEALEAVRENKLKKGDVPGTARIAGIMAAKNTAALIPLAHPLNIDHAAVNFEFEDDGILIRTEVSVEAKTGVEMEALTAASVAALTVYDMVKAVDKSMVITDIMLESKSGGRSGDYKRND